MDENFKCIYKILKTLEAALDYPDFDFTDISHTSLEVSKQRYDAYIEMLSDAGYIKGVKIREDVGGERKIDISRIAITLKGLEYLSENSIMQRMYKAAKGIRDII